jgi:hypothetical protein
MMHSINKKNTPAIIHEGKILLWIFLLLLFAELVEANAGIPGESPKLRDSIVIKKYQNNKHHRAFIYSDDMQENVFFAVNGTHDKSYQLFLFEMDGKLIRETRIPGKQSVLLIKIEKGNYLFELFSEDERIENGSIVIK